MSRKKIIIPIIVFTGLIIILLFIINPSHEFNSLIVNESKWNSIIGTRTENKNLSLQDIYFNEYKLIIDEQSNTLYYSVINESQNKYNPVVNYKCNDKDIKIAVLSEQITDEKIKSDYEFKIIIYNQKQYKIYNLKCTDLPIMNISYSNEDEISEKNIPMEMYLFDNLSNIPNKITVSRGKIKNEQGSYIFSLQMLTPGKNKRDNRRSILNMKPSSEYILTKDQTTSNTQAQQQPKHKIELFLNNQYQGTYYLEGMQTGTLTWWLLSTAVSWIFEKNLWSADDEQEWVVTIDTVGLKKIKKSNCFVIKIITKFKKTSHLLLP